MSAHRSSAALDFCMVAELLAHIYPRTLQGSWAIHWLKKSVSKCHSKIVIVAHHFVRLLRRRRRCSIHYLIARKAQIRTPYIAYAIYRRPLVHASCCRIAVQGLALLQKTPTNVRSGILLGMVMSLNPYRAHQPMGLLVRRNPRC